MPNIIEHLAAPPIPLIPPVTLADIFGYPLEPYLFLALFILLFAAGAFWIVCLAWAIFDACVHHYRNGPTANQPPLPLSIALIILPPFIGPILYYFIVAKPRRSRTTD